ncbi:MAG: phosphoglucosamine mutase [Alphaproteobacteria bacterium]|nr:phosphoglucosamine mutase [Alphaproteobacteria bacterium]
MTRKFFGTDGIRGRANSFPMTADMALKVAMAAALALEQNNGGLHQRRAVIGKDTRLSGYMLEQAMASGFVAMGIDVVLVGPIPTPAIAMLTRTLRADIGVMISASHNPYEDNGIKLFGADGYKLSDEVEGAIESLLDRDLTGDLPPPDRIGKASRLDDAPGRYVEFLKAVLPRRQNFEGLKVVVDCAHGAAYKIAPKLLWELEAEVISIGVQPNGRNINDGYGATSTDKLERMVVEHQAHIGIALDGDADRLILVDEQGRRIDGDQIMALLARHLHAEGKLQNDALVATVMSNLGLERYLKTHGIGLHRTPVGDRHVVEAMRAKNCNLGGEQSGHIILSDFGTTGDGLLAALQVLSIIKNEGKRASEVLNVFTPLPQVLRNVRFEPGAKPLDNAQVKEAITKAEGQLANDGRLLVRASGTEPLIRVMAEGDNETLVNTVVGDLCLAIEEAAKP